MSKNDKSTSRRDFLKMSAVGAPASGLQKGAYYKKYLELAKF